MDSLSANTTQVAGFVGILMVGFIFGRYSHHLSCCKRLAKQAAENGGSYSSTFYKDNHLEHTKLIICARRDLKMGKGKLAAQCCHATMGVVNRVLEEKDRTLLDIWEHYGQPKIVTSANDFETMKEVQTNAEKAGLPTYMVRDAGRTQLEPGTRTVLAVGPAPDSIINPVTRHLKLM